MQLIFYIYILCLYFYICTNRDSQYYESCGTKIKILYLHFILQRMKAAGAFITTSESMLYELTKDTEHPKFKEVVELFTNSGLL